METPDDSPKPEESPELETLGRNVPRRQLVNRLNYLNFQDGIVLVCLRRDGEAEPLLLKAHPLPCAGTELTCRWCDPHRSGFAGYRFDSLRVPDGAGFLLVHSAAVRLYPDGVVLTLPEQCRVSALRHPARHPVRGVRAEVTQNGVLWSGELVEFSPTAFRLAGGAFPAGQGGCIHGYGHLALALYAGERLVYSGDCALERQEESVLVLRPLGEQLRRFPPKKHRSRRHRLHPSPQLVLRHPLTRETLVLPVLELSGSGFSVREPAEAALLIPGLILPTLELVFGRDLTLRCQGQVVHRKGGGKREVTAGVALLDLGAAEQEQLLSVVHRAGEERIALSGEVDLDRLWAFFFATGFIYPEKYLALAPRKEEVKRIYRKLYREHPRIARHFLYLKDGVILGHLAMLRWHRQAWMIHHHAAKSSLTIRAGLAVLEQMGEFLYELNRFPSAHLSYVYCFFRPDNKLPSRVFGGLARVMKDQSRCSLDRFAYLDFDRGQVERGGWPSGWRLVAARKDDFAQLASFYHEHSGGLMLRAFELQGAARDPLAREYRAAGLKRVRRCLALQREGRPALFVLAEESDAGLNLSQLTSAVTVFVLDPELPPRLLQLTLWRLARRYPEHRMPVLVYPASYPERHGLAFPKSYLLWILDLTFSDAWFDFFDELLSRGRTGR